MSYIRQGTRERKEGARLSLNHRPGDNLRYSGSLDCAQKHVGDHLDVRRQMAPSRSNESSLAFSGIQNQGPEQRPQHVRPLSPQRNIYTSGAHVAGVKPKEPQFNYRYAANPKNNLVYSGSLSAAQLKHPQPTAPRPKDQIQGSAAVVEAAPYKPSVRPCKPEDSMISQGVIKVRGIAPERPATARHTGNAPQNMLRYGSALPVPNAPEVPTARISCTSPRDNLRFASVLSSGPEQPAARRVSRRPSDNLFVSGALPYPKPGKERDIMPMW
eukprot:TRINITY_DN7447_c0_g2_i1.p1 TRINITY_DN7447_c0_g2~~TRINITY_DN7447_c0_g2_i1.p1  ORF type:complete len:292 (+),score=30.89 TRINITY_DN7447_c0_g2_i1:64-876(+)